MRDAERRHVFKRGTGVTSTLDDVKAAMPMTFGQRLAAARKRLNLNQEELAVKIGASHSSVRNWENGRSVPHEKWIRPLTRALRCHRAELFGS